MFDFKMTTSENFASFSDETIGQKVYVDSFDNLHFNVRIGSVEQSIPLGTIIAKTDEELNKKLGDLINGDNQEDK